MDLTCITTNCSLPPDRGINLTIRICVSNLIELYFSDFSPRKYDSLSQDVKNVFYLRTYQDAANIATNSKDKNVVLIGSSFIGEQYTQRRLSSNSILIFSYGNCFVPSWKVQDHIYY